MASKKTAGATTTVRFTQVVERSGRPHPHTLWLAPEKDPELMRAISAHRVMMIEPGSSGGKTDFGMVGFDASEAAGAQILIFPKSLKPFEGARVVGIKFDLMEQPTLENARGPSTKLSRRRTALTSRSAGRTARTTPPIQPAPRVSPKSSEPPAPEPEHEKKTPNELRVTGDSGLMREVRAAIKELEGGKAVAAYKRLQRAVS